MADVKQNTEPKKPTRTTVREKGQKSSVAYGKPKPVGALINSK